MTLTISDIKEYLRINHDVDNNFIYNLIETSKVFIQEQTGVIYKAGDKVFEQCILFLVAHLYDNRASITEKTMNEIPYTLDALIRHIKLRGAIDVGGDNE